LAIRFVVRDVPPLEAAAIRFVVAGALLLGLAFVQKRTWPADRNQWNALAVLSLTMMAIPYGLIFWAEQHVTSSMTAVLFSALPLIVSLFTPLMTHHRVPRQAVFAMVIAFGGLLVLFYTGLSSSARTLMGGVAIVAAMVLSAWSVVYAKTRLQNIDPVVGTGLQLLFGSVALLWGTWALEPQRHAAWTQSAVLAMAFLTLFGSCAAFVIYYWLLKKMHPYQLSTTSLIVPVVAVMEGAFIGREMIPPLMLVAIAVVLGSVATVLRAPVELPSEDGRVLMIRERAE
ncbi:MAG TPA: EamA family transporter, partial [Candidatus Angelobacter sp.]|nr:EamA family transporter [Candidatus Angelobacter sp.]